MATREKVHGLPEISGELPGVLSIKSFAFGEGREYPHRRFQVNKVVISKTLEGGESAVIANRAIAKPGGLVLTEVGGLVGSCTSGLTQSCTLSIS